MIAYLLANWKQLGGALVSGAVAAWFLKPAPPQPAVHLVDQEHKTSDAAVEVHKQEAPVRVVVRRYAVPAAGCTSGPVIEERTTERGPVVTDTAKVAHQVDDRRLDLTITPAPRSGWAVGVGLDGLPADRALRISLRRRLFGPFWAEVAVQPATRAVGAGLAMEW